MSGYMSRMLYTNGRPDRRATSAPAMPSMGGSVMASTMSEADGESPRDRQRKISQIIGNAAAHLEARIGGRAHALDDEIAAHFAPQQVTRMMLGGIVARPACQHRHAMIHGEGFRHLRGAFGRGAGIRRKIFVQKKNMHEFIREKNETSVRDQRQSRKSATRQSSDSPGQPGFANQDVAEDQHIHLRAQKTIDGFLGAANDWFIVVERSIQHHRHAE